MTCTRQRRSLQRAPVAHLFDDRFAGKGNDKGAVEGLVGYARRNFFVPVPRFASWDALNLDLTNKLPHASSGAVSHTETIGERFARNRPLPPVPYDACDQTLDAGHVASLVRDRRNDRADRLAPPVVVKGDVNEVVIVCRQ